MALARYARNERLADAIHQWAFCMLTASPGARAYYDQLRARGKTHNAALRQLGNRLVGILHGCLKPAPPTTSTPLGRTAPAHPSRLQPNQPSHFRGPPPQLSTCRSAAGVKVGRRPPAGLP